MNGDDIIRMAELAGFNTASFDRPEANLMRSRLENFAIVVASFEREACAQLAAWILKMPENDVSAAIRARGQS